MDNQKTIAASVLAKNIDYKMFLTIFSTLKTAITDKTKADKNIKMYAGDISLAKLFSKNTKVVDVSNKLEFEHIKKACSSSSTHYAVLRDKSENEEKKYYFVFSYMQKERFFLMLDNLSAIYTAEILKIEREEKRKLRREERKKRRAEEK